MKSRRSALTRGLFVVAFLLIIQHLAMATTTDDPKDISVRQLTIVNTVPDFLRFWDGMQSDDEKTQVLRFRQFVIAKHPELFKGNIIPLFKSVNISDQNRGIAEYLKKIGPSVPAMRVLNQRLEQDLTTYNRDFMKLWPDFKAGQPVYFTISMGGFDGALRDVDGANALLFAVDRIAQIYGLTTNLSVLFDHEIFHVYHRQVAPSLFERDEIWKRLWIEGLAEYVSWRMNPASSEDDVLLSADLRSKGTPLLPCLSASINRDLDSTADRDNERYFLFGPAGGNPPRSGYLVGFEVVLRMGESRTLSDLSRLSGDELKREIAATLSELTGSAVCAIEPTGPLVHRFLPVWSIHSHARAWL